MFKTLVAAVVLLSPVAFAGKLNMDARVDAQSQGFNDDAKAAGMGNTNFRYLIHTARLDYQANFNESTNVRARMVLNKDQGAVNKRDNVNDLIDLFFINHKAAENFELTLGKFSSEMSGWEHQNSSPDMYMYSTVYTGAPTTLNTATQSIYSGKTGNTIGSFTWAKSGTTRYYTGAKATYKVGGQEVALHGADLTADDTTGGSSSQTRTMTGLVYKGSFADKLVQPLLNYHEGFLPGQGSNDAKATFMGAGLRFNFDENTIDAEYLKNDFKSRTLVSTGTYKNDSITSMLLTWGKTFGQWTPRVKIEQSELVAAEEKVFDVKGYGVAVEYRPIADENFRYHVAYNMKDYVPETGNTLSQTEIIVGARILADIMK